MPDNNQIIAASLTVNSDEAVKNVLKLKGTVEDLRKELKNTQAGSDEQVAAFKKLKTAEEDLAKASKQLNEGNKETSGHFGKIKASISEIPGATGQAGKGVAALSTQFKALLANPIVLIITAIVGALTLLYKAFASTAAGADKIEQIFSGIGAAIDVIRDRILKVAGAISKFFSGDFSGAFRDARQAFTGIGDEIADEFKKAADATRQLQEVEDAMRDLGVSRAKLNRDLARTKEIITDENASFAEKKKAIEEVRIAEGKQTEQELANARKKLAAIEARNKLSDVSDEKAQEQADAQAAVFALEEKSASDIRALNKQSRLIENQEEAKRREERQKAAEEEKNRRQQLAEFTNKLTKLQQDNELSLIKDAYEKELKALEFRITEEKRQNLAAFQDRKLTREQLNQLNEALDIQANLQRDAINEKHNKEVAAKELAFQKNIEDLKTKIRLSSITDSRELEKTQLKIAYEEQLKKTIELYKDNQAQFQQAKALIDEQYRIDQQKLDEKNAAEDAKKKLEADIAAQEKIFNDPESSLAAKKAALDQEQVIIQAAFDQRVLTEEEFNKKSEEMSGKRKQLAKLEHDFKKQLATEAADLSTKLADLVGKQTVVGKALGIATALINTYQGASEALKQKSTLPSPFDVIAKIANVATVIATGIKTVKAITAVQVPGGGGGSAPAAPSAPIAPAIPQTTTTKLDADSINNIGNAAAGGVNGIRAYVLEGEITDSQDRQARLSRAARLGG